MTTTMTATGSSRGPQPRLGNFINGEFVAPRTGRYIESFNPSTGRVDHWLPDSEAADVAPAVEAAKRAFTTWSKTGVEERARLLYKVADLIDARAQAFAEAESRDQGKPVWLAASMDIPRVALNFRFFAGAVLHHQESANKMDSGALNYTSRRPVGVAGLISPWNLPLYLLSWKIAPALAAGNTVVCKPSEITSLTAHMLCSVLNDAGVPPGVVNIVFGRGPTAGQALVEHPDVPLISFTGGTTTGERLAMTAAPRLKRMSLELGGKNPNIVFDDADLEESVVTSVRAAFLNQGEICLCGSRLYVQEKIYEPFMKLFREQAAQLRVGDPRDPKTFIGPVASAAHRDKIRSYIEKARNEGAAFILGGDDGPKFEGELAGGYFINPVVVTGLQPSSCVNQEEIFGPFVSVTPFINEDEVVRLANGVKYGLSASVWTKDLSRAHRVAERLDAGTVWINTWLMRDLRVPFGGMKASGLGREGGMHSLEFFTEVKNVCVKY
jgi:acyl-CoA reductase-like NAD-dependent aldehyde dehydrogenase